MCLKTGHISVPQAPRAPGVSSSNALGDPQADKRLEILRLVACEGSISQAARSAGVSYKAAWQAIHTLTNLAGEPLLDSSVGGAGGGGARLTAAGTQLLAAAAQLQAARARVWARVAGARSPALAVPRTSMRNALRAQVLTLESADHRDPMVRVCLSLSQGTELAALITRESAELLALAPGLGLLVLCKATAVRIVPAGEGEAVSPLKGRVIQITRGEQRDELTLQVAGDQRLVGFADHPHSLRRGSRACALMDERAAVLALR